MKDIITWELSEFVKDTKMSVQNMKIEQVNQIKSGVIKELKDVFIKSFDW